ncbi:MAG: hypothetical protein ACFFFK_10015 [Candidatus Thorarchaeota archaeon]
MSRRTIVKTLIIVFGTILLVLTAFEYLIQVYSIAIDPILSYGIQIFYLISILVFLILLVIILNPESPKKNMK